jgi:hypothetical protein
MSQTVLPSEDKMPRIRSEGQEDQSHEKYRGHETSKGHGDVTSLFFCVGPCSMYVAGIPDIPTVAPISMLILMIRR